ncbi:hypothetical protein DFH08DRAFT_778108 [Mycena albidolilacea]|uniref:Bacteriophage T5 Orf172 DNA-binding domain-containing protein n=1 Tax=Mycena albidolilacea TaxID=1033008 RepID=A0AAD7EUA2_9AGAR|nr:hypothetical protein DFH08DRAFT_778108 [Mycena albidolilacea]
MSATYVAKGKAKQFIAKLFDLDSDQKSDSRPPALPPKPSSNYGSDQGVYAIRPTPNTDFVQSFDQLKLSSPSPNVPPPQNQFIGGFHPGHFSPPSLPQPPAMPMPVPSLHSPGRRTSLTMQYALQETSEPPSLLNVPSPFGGRPQSLPPPAVHQSGSDSPFLSPQATGTASASPSAGSPTRTKPRPRRSNSAPTVETCAGFTKAGKRCTREVKSRGPAFSYRLTGDDIDVDGNVSSEGAVERFCYQHIKDFIGGASSVTGFYARKWMGEGKERGDEVWVSFADFIPSYLSPETQVALRVEMEKARSPKDTEGYIYTFEIRDPGSTQIQLKTGRTTHLVRRLDQWTKQCSSKEHVLRGWFPGGVDPETGLPATSLMKGRVAAGSKGASCHRLERLIHLELADLVAEGQYLKSDWKSFKKGQQPVIDLVTPPSTPNKKPAAAALGSGPKCADCGTQHKEIFTFTRVNKGPYKGKEWEGIVKPVVERWGQFVEQYVG